ncbi:partial Nitrogen fixation regulatory protein, partial [Rhodocyclaceae bacterium]
MSLSLTDQRLDAFYEITSDSAVPFEERLQRLLAFGCGIFGLATGILARIRDDHYEIVAVVPDGGELKVGSRLPLGDTYCSQTVRSEHPIGFSRASGTAWERHPCYRSFRLESYLGTQVRVGGRPWGTLSFASPAPMPRDFDAADRGFIKLLAQWIGFGTDWIRLNRQTVRAQAADLSRAMIGAIDEGVICIDTAAPHRVCFVNPLAETLLGLREDAAIGRPLADLVELLPDPGCCCRGIDDWARCPQHGDFEAMLCTAGRPEGFPAALSFAPVALDGDALTVVTLRDIGRSRQTEEKLRLSDKVFEYSAEAIVITDADACILAVNPAFTWLTGYRPDEAIGRTPRILKSGRHDDAFYAGMWQALIRNGHWEGELWDRRKDGTEYPKWL